MATFDDLLEEAGTFGRCQKRVFAMLCLLSLPLSGSTWASSSRDSPRITVMKTSIKWLLDHSHQHLPHPSYDVHQISIQLHQSHQHPSYAAGCLHQ
ncbi:hypothetical protein F7725_019938 [Dissostichus mawsoni]|uniref:Uncharacterized protein n=1 Tax=Dissostichus mawsoni TaxID=36200 RepID=A0A7J5YN75_DISMA|nr:hypothetical protein F7725_019938 [Dissostichus mawsoni]